MRFRPETRHSHQFNDRACGAWIEATSATGSIPAVVRPEQLVNVFTGVFTLYLVATAWMTIRRRAGVTGLFEAIALTIAIVL
jgi:hypothetical protein